MHKLHKFLFFVALLLFFSLGSSPIHAAGWANLSSPTSQTLLSISMQSQFLIAVGENGTVVYSTDGGKTWNQGSSGVSVRLNDVASLSETKAIAVGEDAMILRTVESGKTWSRVQAEGLTSAEKTYDLYAVTFSSSSVGFAVGEHGLTLKTTDSGASWVKITSPTGSLNQTLTNIMAVSSSRLWVCGNGGVIYASRDSGASWTSQTTGTTENLSTVRFSGSSVGWAVGAHATFLRTNDGGSTWKKIAIVNLSSDETIYDVSLSGEEGILVSSGGKLLETKNGGDSWSAVSSSGSPVLRDINRLSSSVWWGVGNSGAIYRYDATSPSKPTQFDVSGDNDAVTDATPIFSWSAASDDESKINSYYFKIDSGTYAALGNTLFYIVSSALKNGEHTAYLYAVDAGGNASSVVSVNFTVDADSTASTAPTVTKLTPSTAIKDETIIFSARLTDDGTMESCDLYVDDALKKSMTVKRDLAYTTFSFSENGTYKLHARCTDDEGNKTTGKESSVAVSSGSTHVTAGSIIKSGCSGNVEPNDPCTAVYFYGVDGKRHAFPTEKIFKTWFEDFDDLVILSANAMSEISLGRNVTVRPGKRLVKFSSNTVYAVSYGGLLRPIANAEIAQAIFGDEWISLIETIDDVFYGNYRIGATIESSLDFSPDKAADATRTINATF